MSLPIGPRKVQILLTLHTKCTNNEWITEKVEQAVNNSHLPPHLLVDEVRVLPETIYICNTFCNKQ